MMESNFFGRMFEKIKEPFNKQEAAIALKSKYENNRVFHWFQGTEAGVFREGGICASMVLDWLRRKYLGKPRYDNPKYQSKLYIGGEKEPGNLSIFSKIKDLVASETNEKRNKLMKKVADIQIVYKSAFHELRDRRDLAVKQYAADHPDTELTFEELEKIDPAAAAFCRGPSRAAFEVALGRLQKQGKSMPRGFADLQQSLIAYQELKGLTGYDPFRTCFGVTISETFAELLGHHKSHGLTVGAYIGLQFPNSGHAIGVCFVSGDARTLPAEYLTPPRGNYLVFDPNFGEYAFERFFDASEFVYELCRAIYPDALSIETSLVTMKTTI
jgi:hypothetical protein